MTARAKKTFRKACYTYTLRIFILKSQFLCAHIYRLIFKWLEIGLIACWKGKNWSVPCAKAQSLRNKKERWIVNGASLLIRSP